MFCLVRTYTEAVKRPRDAMTGAPAVSIEKDTETKEYHDTLPEARRRAYHLLHDNGNIQVEIVEFVQVKKWRLELDVLKMEEVTDG